ncbi:MAG: FAD-dependent oxidoreductase, partial [Thermodesulfobacteriota bacterium]|nr:FAD-dependent oxidoreductase [Thermodesulfobacteriota bacterium]
LPSAKVLVIDRNSFISYGACGMPYYVSGDIENVDKLRETPYGIIRDPEFFRSAKDIEIITETQVERIDREAKKISCTSTKTGESSDLSYDKLILATGASPIQLPGIPKNSKRIITFKVLQDAIDLKKSLQLGEIEKVGIIGGGFIGCELAESFGSLWGADVVLFDAAPTILPTILDSEMAKAVEVYLKTEGVEIHTDCPLEGMTESEEDVTIKTKDGLFSVDYAVMAVGVKPNSGLAVECGLKVGKAGGIIVDDAMTTSDPDISAAGDCVEVRHFVSGRSLQLPLGSLANRQGRIVGSNLGGGDERFGAVVGSAAVKIFDMNVASTGLTEASAKDAEFNVGCVWGTFTDKADYFPGAENIHLKLVFDKTSSRLLGLQGYGKGEVVKRVDVFAALLKNKGRLEDLLDMEFAYAPPYAPAVDPLFSLGCAARNSLLEGVEALSPQISLDDKLIIDVRTAQEFENKPFQKGETLNIPYERIRERGQEILKDKDLICVCSKGVRSAESLRILKEKGFSNVSYIGGGVFMIPDFGEE